MAGALTGKKALVGGGSQGIGRACAIELAKLGATITVMARDAKALADVVARLDGSAGQKHDFLAVDFSDPNALRDKVARHIQDRGPVQILINNTGGPPHGALLEAVRRG